MGIKKKNDDAKDKTKKSNYILAVCESLCTQPLICECSAGALRECCQRPLTVICVWLRVSSVCMCALSVFLSAAAAGTHASPPHRDTHQTLFSCSPDLLLTFPPYSPPPTLAHTQHSTESMFFPSSWTALSPCSVSLRHPPLSCIPLFISLSPSLSLAQTPRQLVSGELNIDLAGLSMPGEWGSVHQRPRHRQPAIDVFRGQNGEGGGWGN